MLPQFPGLRVPAGRSRPARARERLALGSGGRWIRRSSTRSPAVMMRGLTGLMASHWYAYVDSGRLVTLRSWIGSVDDGALGADPVAAHCAAWAARWPAIGKSSGGVPRSWKQPSGRSRCPTACDH